MTKPPKKKRSSALALAKHRAERATVALHFHQYPEEEEEEKKEDGRGAVMIATTCGLLALVLLVYRCLPRKIGGRLKQTRNLTYLACVVCICYGVCVLAGKELSDSRPNHAMILATGVAYWIAGIDFFPVTNSQPSRFYLYFVLLTDVGIMYLCDTAYLPHVIVAARFLYALRARPRICDCNNPCAICFIPFFAACLTALAIYMGTGPLAVYMIPALFVRHSVFPDPFSLTCCCFRSRFK